MTNRVPRSSRSALRRLMLILAIAAGVVIYAYGWAITDISLDEVQDPIRQASVQRAMRELLSPDIFTRDRENRSLFVEFAIGCPEGDLPAGRVETDGDAYVIFTPPCADSDEVISVEGFHFPANAIARVQLAREGAQKVPFKLTSGITSDAEVSDESVFDIDRDGYFKVSVKVPKGRGLSGETHPVEIQTAVPSGWPRLSDTSETVIDKMIETIFLALMATTLALPVAVALSFVAARNLMRQITLPLGNVLVGFVLIPVGGWLGYQVLGPLGQLGVRWGEDVLPGLGGSAGALAGFVLISYALGRLSLAGRIVRARAVALNALLVAALVFILGVLGGLGVWLGDKLQTGLLADLGNFVGTLGQLVDLLIATLAALGGAIWLSGLGAGLVAGPMRHIFSPLSNVLGAVLGALSGAILLAATALVGTQAVLLGLLTPIVAAALGGQLAIELYYLLPGARKPKRDRTDVDQMIHTLLYVIGAVLAFAITAYAIDLLRAIVDERPPSRAMMDLGLFEMRAYVFRSALVGAVLGGLAAGLAGTQVAFPLGMSAYNTTRTVLNALRSIEPLIMGIVFVIWVGVGPFAGVLALTLHSIASLGKLYSEQVESIDAGPIEAIQSTGANRLQTIVYAVVPQIVPPYIAFTMYRWDINVRMSTIIGFVGGGGIGFLLQQQINLLRYSQAGVAVLAIAIVVSILDYASAAIRERIV
jgi:phosphonate ABC transporter permease subunit PhnE